MSSKGKLTSALAKSIRELILEAQKNEKREHGAEARYAFFRPVSIKMAGGGCYSAFSREISVVGLGLLHNMALPPGHVECRISSAHGQTTTLPLKINWCQPCGEGSYISGGEFIGIDGIGN